MGKTFFAETPRMNMAVAFQRNTGTPHLAADAFETFLRGRVLDPLGMKDTRNTNYADLIPNRASGCSVRNGVVKNADRFEIDEFANGSLISTAGDMAKFEVSLTTEKVLKHKTLAQMSTNAILNSGEIVPQHGLGLGVTPFKGRKRIGHNGGGGLGFATSFTYFPAEKIWVVILSNAIVECRSIRWPHWRLGEGDRGGVFLGMAVRRPFNFKQWIDDHRHLLKPPVGNQCVYDDDDFIVMAVGGPNSRKDYHWDEGEELFYQIEGDIKVQIQEDGQAVEVPILEGEMFLLPPRIPHNPIRGADTVGLVIERKRRDGELDGLLWFCESCNSKLYEEYFQLTDITTQFQGVFARFYDSEDLRTCSSCGVVMEAPMTPG